MAKQIDPTKLEVLKTVPWCAKKLANLTAEQLDQNLNIVTKAANSKCKIFNQKKDKIVQIVRHLNRLKYYLIKLSTKTFINVIISSDLKPLNVSTDMIDFKNEFFRENAIDKSKINSRRFAQSVEIKSLIKFCIRLSENVNLQSEANWIQPYSGKPIAKLIICIYIATELITELYIAIILWFLNWSAKSDFVVNFHQKDYNITVLSNFMNYSKVSTKETDIIDGFVDLVQVFLTKSIKKKFVLKNLMTTKNYDSLQRRLNRINADKGHKNKLYNVIQQYCKIFDENFDKNFDYLDLDNPMHIIVIIMLFIEAYPIIKYIILNIFLQNFKFNSV